MSKYIAAKLKGRGKEPNQIESLYVILIIANYSCKENEPCGVAGSVRDISDTTESFREWFAKGAGWSITLARLRILAAAN